MLEKKFNIVTCCKCEEKFDFIKGNIEVNAKDD